MMGSEVEMNEINKILRNGTLRDKIGNIRREIEQKKKDINYIKREIEQKEKEIEEYKRELDSVWTPIIAIPLIPNVSGVKFYSYLTDGTTIEEISCCGNGSNYTSDLSKLGLSFNSKTEAKMGYEKRCAETELLSMCDGWNIKFSEKVWFPVVKAFCSNGEPYCLKWVPEMSSYNVLCPYRFASKESCQAAIDKLGDKKLRLIFNISLQENVNEL